MIGQRRAQFEIREILGEGAMGPVYGAVDTSREREVALKILPAAFCEDRDRLVAFQRDAKILLALAHPNLASIYGIVEADGDHCLILERVKGETLASKLVHGPLGVAETAALGAQVASLLDVAHRRDLWHQDLRPSNLAIDAKGKVKVLDFGLARLGDSAGTSMIRRLMSNPNAGANAQKAAEKSSGLGIGVAAYMSPEQLRGWILDARSDIWSLGCCLFEMLTGKRPFAGETKEELLESIQESQPDWLLLPAETSSAFRNLLRCCLEKDPQRRLESAGDLARALEEASVERPSRVVPKTTDESERAKPEEPPFAGGLQKWAFVGSAGIVFVIACWLLIQQFLLPEDVVLEPVQTVALLPLTSPDGEAQLAAMASGMTESMRLHLSGVAALDQEQVDWEAVAALSDSGDLADVAGQLGADAVLSGALVSAEEGLTIELSVYRHGEQPELWSTNLVSEQPLRLSRESISTALGLLGVSAPLSELGGDADTETVGLRAYGAFQEARVQLQNPTPLSIAKAKELLGLAMRQDANYLPAYLGLARLEWEPNLYGGRAAAGRVGYSRASAVLDQAGEELSRRGELAGERGRLNLFGNLDWGAAKVLLSGRDDLDADRSGRIAFALAEYQLLVESRHDESLNLMVRVVAANPYSVAYQDQLAAMYGFCGRWAESIEQNEAILVDRPADWRRRLDWVLSKLGLGRDSDDASLYSEAVEAAKQVASESGRTPAALAVLAEAHYAAGNPAAAESLIEELSSQAAIGQLVPSVWRARIELARGRADSAVGYLEKAYELKEGYSLLVHLRRADMLSRLQNHPGYWGLIEKMGMPALPLDHAQYEAEREVRFGRSMEAASRGGTLGVRLPSLMMGEDTETRWLPLGLAEDLVRRLNNSGMIGAELISGEPASPFGRELRCRIRLGDQSIELLSALVDPRSGLEQVLEPVVGRRDGLYELLGRWAVLVSAGLGGDVGGDALQRLQENPLETEVGWKANRQAVSGLFLAYPELDDWVDARFAAAIEADPGRVSTVVRRAQHAWWRVIWGDLPIPAQEAVAQAETWVEDVDAESDPQGLVNSSLGWIALLRDRAWSRAYQFWNQSSDWSGSRLGLAWYALLVEGRGQDAVAAFDELIQDYPSDLRFVESKALVLELMGRYQEAIEVWQGVPDLAANWRHLVALGSAQGSAGLLTDAHTNLKSAAEMSERHPTVLAAWSRVEALRGEAEAAEALLLEVLQQRGSGTWVPSGLLVGAYVAAGEKELALGALEDAVGESCSWVALTLRTSAMVSAFQDEAAYWDLVRELALPPLPIFHPLFPVEQQFRYQNSELEESPATEQP